MSKYEDSRITAFRHLEAQPPEERKPVALTPLERELLEALRRAVPALWIVATSGNADAVAIHDQARRAIRAAEEREGR
jgi:nitrogen fixation protein FixH